MGVNLIYFPKAAYHGSLMETHRYEVAKVYVIPAFENIVSTVAATVQR